MESLKFGTSGLRGLVTSLEGRPSFLYTAAFLRAIGPQAGADKTLLIGRDLRPSSPGIAATVATAAAAEGFTAIDCGVIPTPALALEALRRRVPAIMVTGSHIPDDRNGLKFYRPDGEIAKADEPAILAALAGLDAEAPLPATVPPRPEPAAADHYRARYVAAFGPDALAGLTVAVYQQTSVARDLMVDLLRALGATVRPIGRAEKFVPIDTEAHRPEDIAFIKAAAAADRIDALVTTDGDADRPLVADANGRILRGDVLGLITAAYIGADAVVVPVTAGSAIERTGGFSTVVRTKVGSPFVIAGMAEAVAAGGRVVAGFEANGGFLLGADIAIAGRPLAALPTRDAMLPIIATLAAARAKGVPLADLVAGLDAGEMMSDRLEHIPSARSAAFLRALDEEATLRAFLAPVGRVESVNKSDGLRVELDGKRTIHFRASGNAPELRCYTEAATAQEADQLLRWGLNAALERVS